VADGCGWNQMNRPFRFAPYCVGGMSTYWRVGERIVEHEQKGSTRAAYGQELLKRLSQDLVSRLGRGFKEPRADAPVLFELADPADTVCGFSTRVDIADGVCDIFPYVPTPASLVPLRAIAVGGGRPSSAVLRAGGARGRLVSPPTRSSDCQSGVPTEPEAQEHSR